jgi:hypothetical protein
MPSHSQRQQDTPAQRVADIAVSHFGQPRSSVAAELVHLHPWQLRMPQPCALGGYRLAPTQQIPALVVPRQRRVNGSTSRWSAMARPGRFGYDYERDDFLVRHCGGQQ